MDHGSSGVGVLDKCVALLRVVGGGPASLADLQAGTGLPRATAHRLAAAMETTGLLARDPAGSYVVGGLVATLAAAPGVDPLLLAAPAVLARLRDRTGESAQLYVRRGAERVCVAAADRASGLRDTVPVGAVLPLTAGSAAQVLLASEPPDALDALLRGAAFDAPRLDDVRRRGWARSAGEREQGLASVSAPVRRDGHVVAAVGVSGPLDRIGRDPSAALVEALQEAAAALSAGA